MENYHGSLRILNLKTLEKWVQNGSYKKQLDSGYIYNVGCGRFTIDKCKCSRCLKGVGKNRLLVIKRHYKG